MIDATLLVAAGLLIYLFIHELVKLCVMKWVSHNSVSNQKAESICKMFSLITLNLSLSK